MHKKPHTLLPFSTAKPRTFNALLCDGVTAHQVAAFTDLLALQAQLQQAQPQCRVLASLDDFAQACYTSGHGADVYQLDSTLGHDLSGLDASLFEAGVHCGYLSTPAEFPIRLANLRQAPQSIDFAQLMGKLEWQTPDAANDLLSVNTAPDEALLIAEDEAIIFQFVPVICAADAIAAFPNGYFTNDLNPMQNHVLAQHLETTYGLALFGIGSRFLGFRCAQPMSAQTAKSVASDLGTFYRGTPQAKTDALARLLAGRDWLLLRYSES
jgi:hypothetical protein